MRDLALVLAALYAIGAFCVLLGWLLDDCDPWWGFIAAPLWGVIVIYAIVKHTLNRPTPRTDG